jgi:CBS domain containing-hemolysin-like protein
MVVLGFTAVASGFFSGSETALIGIGRERVHQLSEHGRRGLRVRQLVADPDRLLSTILVANNLVNILGASVATTLFIDLLGEQWGPWVATLVVTAVVLVVGEITPKTLAARYPEQFSLAVAPTIWRLSLVLGPVAKFFTGITRGIMRVLGLPDAGSASAVTEADIRALAELGLAEGEIEQVEHEILDALFTLADRPVRDIMTPRTEIVTLSMPFTLDDVRKRIADTGHSRFPVSKGDLDHLQGVLYVKDLFQLSDPKMPDVIPSLLRPARYIPESASILSVLQDMRAKRTVFGVVLDEHGGVEGIVTVKDLMAELVGTLRDEYDPGEPSAVQTDTGQWVTDGRLSFEDLESELGIDLPDGPYATVAGLYLYLAGRIPQEGDLVTFDGLTLTVISMERNRIAKIRVERTPGTGTILREPAE